MSKEQPPINIGNIKPGDTIFFDDITQISSFEDMMAEYIDPGMTAVERNAWLTRDNLKDWLRPPKFNGSIADIELVAMDVPYARLLDARERGWKMQPSGGSRSANPDLIKTFHGFTFLANARSSRKGAGGQIRAELWYGRAPFRTRKYSRSERRSNIDGHAGASVIRIATKPKMEADNFIRSHAEARRIGFAVLQANLQMPIQNGFTQ